MNSLALSKFCTTGWPKVNSKIATPETEQS